MGMLAGGIGSFVGNPSELALVRMSADSKAPPEIRRNYTSVIDCIRRIWKEEGPTSLWKGAAPTVIRAILVGSCLMGLSSQTKEKLIESGYFNPKVDIYAQSFSCLPQPYE